MINRIPKCKCCRTRFIPKFKFMKFCLQNAECEMAAIQFGIAEVKKKSERDWQKEKKVLKEKLKTLSEYEKEAKVFFQHWIRIRDNSKGYDCISCGAKITIPTSDGSHYYNANQFSGLIFDENNCHASCQKCNRFEGGRLLDYREGLIARYGIEYLNELESKKETHRNYKYSKGELIEIKNKYQKLISKFKSK